MAERFIERAHFFHKIMILRRDADEMCTIFARVYNTRREERVRNVVGIERCECIFEQNIKQNEKRGKFRSTL